MLLQNGQVFRSDGHFTAGDVLIADGRFCDAAEPPDGAERIDASGLRLIPGLVDIHFHGCMGHDLCDGDGESIRAIADYEERQGVTAICPATMTLPEEELLRICRAAAAWQEERGAALVGIRLEGPFLSKEKCGAQDPAYLVPPDPAMFLRLQEAAQGLIRIVDLAPETEGAFAFIEAVGRETVLSLAHTNADYDLASRAFAAGVKQVTHLFNAMNGMGTRNPGPIPAAADAGSVRVEMICDGIHIHPAMVRTAFRMFGDDRIIFISDSMEAAGMEDGDYRLGGQQVTKRGHRAQLADGTIAGSAVHLMECLRIAVRDMGIPLASAVKCASINPARAIGIDRDHGSIEPGKKACLVALDEDLRIVMVFNHGVRIR
ncbi:MAG: N-acetylglucosamine-6-phosphate deacetylase [Lachnospiraceae bacterium]|nr:N-acetylglucosamine-6-phosphate deacetylase [Lachnospiraceae bacterium]